MGMKSWIVTDEHRLDPNGIIYYDLCDSFSMFSALLSVCTPELENETIIRNICIQFMRSSICALRVDQNIKSLI